MATIPESFSVTHSLQGRSWNSLDTEVAWLKLTVPLSSPSGYFDHTSTSRMLEVDNPSLSGRYGRWDNEPVGGGSI